MARTWGPGCELRTGILTVLFGWLSGWLVRLGAISAAEREATR